MNHVQHITQDQFESEVVHSEVPVIVDFYADWCMPCKMMGGVLQKVAGQLGDRAKIVQVDVDENPELASAFRVSSIPALFVVHHGKVVDGGVGVMPADRLVNMVQRAAGAS